MNLILKSSINNILRFKILLIIQLILLICAVAAFIVIPLRSKSALMAIKQNGVDDSVFILEKGNLQLAFSRVDEDAYQFIKTAPHIKKKDNEPLVSPYLQMTSIIGKQFIMLRGITNNFYNVREGRFRIIKGKDLKDEYDILIGHLLPARLNEKYDVGDFISLEGKKWKIVGIFKAERDPINAGAMVSIEDFKEVSARGTYSFIEIKVDNSKNIPELVKYINRIFGVIHDEFPDASLIMAMPEKKYWGELAKMFKMSKMISRVATFIVVFCLLLFMLNISHSMQLGRNEEMSTLYKTGTSKLSIFSGVVLEIFIFSIAAGLIGSLVSMTFNGQVVNLQLSTVLLQIGPSVFKEGVIAGLIFGSIANLPLAFKPIII